MSGSFRDPAGSVFPGTTHFYRFITQEFEDTFRAYESTNFAHRGWQQGSLVTHTHLEAPPLEVSIPKPGIWVEHPRIPFPNYPEEWSWTMLRDAATLTLDLALAAEVEGFELKDANPRNVMFEGSQPCFLDPLSFQWHKSDAPGWLPLGEFHRGFLFPLALASHHGIATRRLHLSDRDGASHQETARIIGRMGALKRPFFRWLTLPRWMAPLESFLEQAVSGQDNPPQFRRSLLEALRRDVLRLTPPPPESPWEDYEDTRTYSPGALEAKHGFIQGALSRLAKGSKVLDLGANRGEFSLLACRGGMQVVAVDQDATCVDQLYLKARETGHHLTPLIMDLSRPTPAQGWETQEQASFLERAQGNFDLVMALALVHHLRFAAGIPLERQFRQLVRFTRKLAILEWVPENDPQVIRLIKRFHYSPPDYHRDGFMSAMERHFHILDQSALEPGGRHLFLVAPR